MSLEEPLGFRPLGREDFPLLELWLGREHVARWWNPHERDGLEEHYGPSIDGTDPTTHFVVLVAGRPVGMVQHYRVEDYADWSHALGSAGVRGPCAGLDYLIGEPELIGIGLGPRMLALLVEDVWDSYPDLDRIAVAVQQANRRSWRALEKVGFERVYTGMIDSDDPSDAGPSYLYLLERVSRPGEENDRSGR
jgi:aminoglycoside 6'-N-acetyltransferase